jgi:uncharacterized membrane protein
MNLGIISLAVAGVAFVVAWIPGISFLVYLLPPVGAIIGIVDMMRKAQENESRNLPAVGVVANTLVLILFVSGILRPFVRPDPTIRDPEIFRPTEEHP